MSEQTLSTQDLQQRMASGAPFLLLDVRNAADYAAYPQRIPGALKLDAEVIGSWASMLPKERDVIAYCQHGQRLSGLTVDALLARGYRAQRLTGGMDAWLEAQGELTEG